MVPLIGEHFLAQRPNHHLTIIVNSALPGDEPPIQRAQAPDRGGKRARIRPNLTLPTPWCRIVRSTASFTQLPLPKRG